MDEITASIKKRQNNLKVIGPSEAQLASQTTSSSLNDRLKKLSERISSAQSEKDLDDLSEELRIFEKDFSLNTPNLPGYEVKSIQKCLINLRLNFEEIKTKFIPKQKFRFRARKIPVKKEDRVAFKSTSSYLLPTYGNLADDTILIRDGDLDPVISDCVNCKIIVDSFIPSTIHFIKLKNCIVRLGPVSTSVYIEKCSDSKFSFLAQQLRMHESENCGIYYHSVSNSMMEDCKNISLAPYNDSFENLDSLINKSKLDISVNNWNSINDFNWLSPDTPSPNWTVIAPENRYTSWSE